MDLIRQIIPNHGSINSKAVAKVFFRFMYRWTELRNLQEPFIWTVVSCTIYNILECCIKGDILPLNICIWTPIHFVCTFRINLETKVKMSFLGVTNIHSFSTLYVKIVWINNMCRLIPQNSKFEICYLEFQIHTFIFHTVCQNSMDK